MIIKQNRALVDMILIQAEVDRDEHVEDTNLERQAYEKHKQVAQELLDLDTGSWGSEHITHHCKGVLCCPHGIRESRAKIQCAVLVTGLNLVLFSRIGIFFCLLLVQSAAVVNTNILNSEQC